MSVFLIAGGGTGGHISPAIAVAEALDSRLGDSLSVHFAATGRPVDRRMYARFGEMVHYLDPPRIDGGARGMVRFALGAPRAWKTARALVSDIGPEAILCTGGYSSVFCAAAGRSLGIPVLLHESNAIPGRANRFSARFASRILLGFSQAARFFPAGRTVVTGNPVRASIARRRRSDAVSEMGLDPSRPVLLFLGGSQGARTVNDLALTAPGDVQMVLQCGERDMERVSGELAGRPGAVVKPFVDDPSILYSCATLAVARAGAMTLAELGRFGLPAVLIPLPGVSRDHQTANARAAEATGGAIVIPQSELDAGDFWCRIGTLIGDPEAMREMSSAIGRLFPGDAAGMAADLMIGAAGGRDA